MNHLTEIAVAVLAVAIIGLAFVVVDLKDKLRNLEQTIESRDERHWNLCNTVNQVQSGLQLLGLEWKSGEPAKWVKKP